MPLPLTVLELVLLTNFAGLAVALLWVTRRPGGRPHEAATHRAAWMILAGLLVTVAVVAATNGTEQTNLRESANVAKRVTGTDSWWPMIDAAEMVEQEPDVRLYQRLFFERKVKFQYPPSSLLPIYLLRQTADLDRWRIRDWLNRFSGLCVLVMALVFAALLDGALRQRFPDSVPATMRQRALVQALGALAVATYYPFLKSYTLGQLQTSISLFAALALLAWQRDNKVIAGILIGFCCSMKPQWLMLLPWALLRAERRFAASTACIAAAMFGAGLFVYGWQNLLDYGRVLSYLSQHGESFYANQSVNGLIGRALSNGPNLQWEANAFPPYHPIVYGATLSSSLVLLGVGLLWRRKANTSAADLALMIMCLTMASPIAWEHHYGVVLPMLALLLPLTLSQDSTPAPTSRPIAVLALAWVLVGQNLDRLTQRFAETAWNPLQCSLLFGALLLLALMMNLSAKGAATAPTIAR